MSATLHAVLIATDGETLLLPNTAVADVLSHDALVAEPSRQAGCVGSVEWRDSQVPVAHLRSLSGGEGPVLGGRTRVVLLQGLGAGDSGGVFGVLAQGYPHLVTLNAAALQPVESEDDDPKILARCRLASQAVVIPDLAYIEQALTGG